jgi:tetratricopeptide (TPR) repeat protein
MTDSTGGANPISALSQATEIIAAHGVYALTAIFIFYQQRRTYDALKNAAPSERAYFRKVYTSVVVATYTLMALSTGIWFYANFMYTQRAYVKGTLMGLTEQRTSPSNAKDQPEILQEIAPVSNVELYVDKKFTDASAMDGKYDLSWVLFPKEAEKVDNLMFRFQQHYEVWSAEATNANPFDTRPSSSKEARTIPLMFGLDLANLHYSPGHSIQLLYEPDAKDSVRKVGKLYVLLEGRKILVNWQELISEQEVPENGKPRAVSSRAGSFLQELKVYAASADGKMIFKDNGEYDPGLAGILRERLGSTNLSVQMEAINVLVDQGSRAFKFIADSLTAPAGPTFDEELLKHNLAAVVDRLEAKGVHAPPKLSVQFALLFYTDQDYKSAARFFDRAGEEPYHDDENLFFMAYAHQNAGSKEQKEKAVLEYRQYLKKSHKKQYDAVAWNNLGNVTSDLGRSREAVEEYRKAIELLPKYAAPYNNLAYLYAQMGENLTLALELVDSALRLEDNDLDIAREKDTKGWVLFKSGKPIEGLALIQEAAAKLPADPDVQNHLSAIRQATGVAKK